MNKLELAKDIGNFFGKYFEENNQYCIDNYAEIFRYDTLDELLTDWVDTLVCHQRNTESDSFGNWEKEIIFIYSEVIGKYPKGIRTMTNKKTWEANGYIVSGTPHGKMVSLGTYYSIVDAIVAYDEFNAYKQTGIRTTMQLLHKAEEIKEKAALNRKKEKLSKKEMNVVVKIMDYLDERAKEMHDYITDKERDDLEHHDALIALEEVEEIQIAIKYIIDNV